MDSHNTSIPSHQNAQWSASDFSQCSESLQNVPKKSSLEIPKLKITKQSESPNNRYLRGPHEGDDKLLLKNVPSIPDEEGIPKKDDSAFTNDLLISNPKKSNSNAPVSMSFSKSKDEAPIVDSGSKKESITANISQKTSLTNRTKPIPEEPTRLKTIKSEPKPPSFAFPASAMLHYSKIKHKVGMNTHIAHERPFRDIPCTSKDFDLALDATRLIELNHERLRQRRIANQKRALSADKGNSYRVYAAPEKKNESFVMNFDNDKFPLNNPIFQTFWEKIFIKRDAILNSTKQNVLWDHSHDEQRLVSKFAFRTGLSYFHGNIGDEEKFGKTALADTNKAFIRMFDSKGQPVLEIEGPKRIPKRNLATPHPGAKKAIPKENSQNQSLNDTENANAKTQANTKWGRSLKASSMPSPHDSSMKETILSLTHHLNRPFTPGQFDYDPSKEQYESMNKRNLMRKLYYLNYQKLMKSEMENPLELLSNHHPSEAKLL